MAAAKNGEHRAVVDDFAAAGTFHRFINGLRTEKGAAEVGLDDALPFCRGELVRLFANIDAGIVDQNINLAKRLDRLRHHGLNIAFCTDIDLHFEHLDAVLCTERGSGFSRFCRIARGNDDIRTGCRQALRHATAQTTIAAGDNRHLTA